MARWPWALPLASFVAGCASFALVKRGEAMAQWIALLAAAGWLWLYGESLVSRLFERHSGRPLSPALRHMITQSLQQELLFFALPFLYGATQRDVGHWLFTGTAVAAAILTTLDRPYAHLVGRLALTRLLFHAYCCVVASLVVLPVAMRLPIEHALPASLAIGGLGLLLGLPSTLRQMASPRQRIGALAVLLAFPALVWVGRAHIPAAGLWVMQASLSRSIDRLKPGPEIERISLAELRETGMVAFVRIRAPTGLAQTLHFVWKKEGGGGEAIPATIQGRSESGWRTYTRKRNFPPDAVGRWTVDVRTPDGQLLCRRRFEVTSG